MNSLFTILKQRLAPLLIVLGLTLVGLVVVAPAASAAPADIVDLTCQENGDVELKVTQGNLVPGSSVVFGGATDGGTPFNTTALVDETGTTSPSVTFTAATFAAGEYSMNNTDGSVIVSGRFGDGFSCAPPVTVGFTLLGGTCPNVNGGVAAYSVNGESNQPGVPFELNVRWDDGASDSVSGTTGADGTVLLEASATTPWFSGHWSVSSGSTLLGEADFELNCGAPTLNLSASVTTITVGQSVTLNWTSVNAPVLSASGGGWTGSKASPNGSEVVTPTAAGTYVYTLTAQNASGIPTVKSVTVTVKPVPAPVVQPGKKNQPPGSTPPHGNGNGNGPKKNR